MDPVEERLDVETRRLSDAGQSAFSFGNRIVQAWLRGALVMALVIIGGGWVCFLAYLLAIAYAKFILEGLNFFSHYGLVRGRRPTDYPEGDLLQQ